MAFGFKFSMIIPDLIFNMFNAVKWTHKRFTSI